MDKYLKFAREYGLYYDRCYHPDGFTSVSVRSDDCEFEFYFSKEVLKVNIGKTYYHFDKVDEFDAWDLFKKAIKGE